MILYHGTNTDFQQIRIVFFSSRTFDALSKPDTGLFFQSPAYILDEFKNEIS